MTEAREGYWNRRAVLGMAMTGAVAAGAGALAPTTRETTALADTVVLGVCNDSRETILNTALVLERLAATFYYRILTTPAVMHDGRLGGSSADPNNPGLPPNGTPGHVHAFQAALDAEMKHIVLLEEHGARSPRRRFFFPQAAFEVLGSTYGEAPRLPTALGVLEDVETILAGFYTSAVSQFLRLNHPDLAALAARLLCVEAEHRTLGRVVGRIAPPNNVTLGQVPFACAADAMGALAPYLTGHGLTGKTTQALAVPTQEQARRVIGRYSTRLLSRYL